MVNSSWTEEHINELWLCSLKTHRVYPPCDVEELKKMPLLSEGSNLQSGKKSYSVKIILKCYIWNPRALPPNVYQFLLHFLFRMI